MTEIHKVSLALLHVGKRTNSNKSLFSVLFSARSNGQLDHDVMPIEV